MATPTAASIATAKKAWEWMDAAGQQSFLKSNAWFDINKYGFSPMKTATVTPPTPVTPVTPPTPKVDNGAEFGANKVATPVPVQPVATPTPATPVQTQTPTPTQTIKATPQKKVTTAETNTAITNKYASLDELKSSPWYATLTPDLQKKAEMAFNKWTETPTQWTETQTPTKVNANPDDSESRLTAITANLTKYTQTDPQIFKDPNTYHDFLDYDNRSEKQKKVIDDFWLSNKRKLTTYNQMSADQLAEWVVNGDFSESDLDYMKADDRVKYWQYEMAKTAANNKLQANIAAQSYNALFWDSDKNKIPDYIDKMNASTDASLKAMEDYKNTKNSPEMLQLTTDMQTLQKEISGAQTEQQDIKKNIEAQYGSLPKSLLNAMIADATSDIQSTITKKSIDYNAKQWAFQSKLAVAKDEYDMQTARVTADTAKITNALNAFNSMTAYQNNMIQNTKPTLVASPIWGFASQSYNQETGQWEQKQYDASGNLLENISDNTSNTNTDNTNTSNSNGLNTRAVTNNNPWNITDTNFGNPTGKDDKWFATFKTLQDWFDALVDKVNFNQTDKSSKYYWTTIAGYFKKYAPTSAGNDPTGYAATVAQALWVSVDTPISQLDPTAFAQQISKHEDINAYNQLFGGQNNDQSANQNKVQYSPTQTAAMDAYLASPTDLNAAKFLSPQKLSINDVNNYSEWTATGTTWKPYVDTSVQWYNTTKIAGWLTQSAIDTAAINYAITGVMPSIWMWWTGVPWVKKTAIENRAAELGNNQKITTNKANYQAYSAALKERTDYLAKMQTWYETVDANLKILMAAADKVNKNNSPLINEWGNLVKSKIIWNGDLWAYQAAITAVRKEYARILAWWGSGASPTDAQNKVAHDLLPDNITKTQLVKKIATLMAEWKNVISWAQSVVNDYSKKIDNILWPNLYKTGTTQSSSSNGWLTPAQQAAKDYLNSIKTK